MSSALKLTVDHQPRKRAQVGDGARYVEEGSEA